MGHVVSEHCKLGIMSYQNLVSPDHRASEPCELQIMQCKVASYELSQNINSPCKFASYELSQNIDSQCKVASCELSQNIDSPCKGVSCELSQNIVPPCKGVSCELSQDIVPPCKGVSCALSQNIVPPCKGVSYELSQNIVPPCKGVSCYHRILLHLCYFHRISIFSLCYLPHICSSSDPSLQSYSPLQNNITGIHCPSLQASLWGGQSEMSTTYIHVPYECFIN